MSSSMHSAFLFFEHLSISLNLFIVSESTSLVACGSLTAALRLPLLSLDLCACAVLHASSTRMQRFTILGLLSTFSIGELDPFKAAPFSLLANPSGRITFTVWVSSSISFPS